MGLRVHSSGKPERVDVARFELPPEGEAWLSATVERICHKPLSELHLSDLDALASAADLSPGQRELVLGVKRSMLCDVRGVQGRTVSKDGGKDLEFGSVLQLTTSKAPRGEPERVARVRAEMPNHLWGHETELDAFVRLAKDYCSPARLSPPVMALTGDVAHGKDQALAGLAKSLLDDASIISVDCAASDNELMALFDGPLKLDDLKAAAEKQRAMIVMKNADNLQKRAPKFAHAISALLLARKNEANCAFLPYVFDFDKPGDPRALLVGALGATGNRLLSATSAFAHLDPETMWRYAEVEMKTLHDQVGLKTIALEFDPDARDVLSRMLCTPHAPLDELPHRLLRFVYDQCDTQTSIDREQASLRVRLTAPLQAAADARDQTITMAHTLTPDLGALGARAVRVVEVAKRLPAEAAKARAGLQDFVAGSIAQGRAMVAALRQDVSLGDAESMQVLDDTSATFAAFEALASRMARDIARREKLGVYELLSADNLTLWQSATSALDAALTRVQNDVLLVMAVDPQETKSEALQVRIDEIRESHTILTTLLAGLGGAQEQA